MKRHSALAAFAIALGLSACHGNQVAKAEDKAAEPAKTKDEGHGKGDPKRDSKHADKDKGEKADKGEKGDKSDKGGDKVEDPKKYAVPFAWEASHDEPLSQVRSYMRSLLSDNTGFMSLHDASHFKPFVDSQKPRATLLTCSDSRVQSPAFDAAPENDLFTIRNIGNQFGNAEGSIEYGVEHLKTPVVLVMGHTGCGAVKAAMGDTSKLSGAIRHELRGIHVPKKKDVDPQAWGEAVIANVNDQVSRVLEKFPEEVEQGQVTVVGVVYDFRNDFKKGYGKVLIVNVNGNTETAKLAAFERAIAGVAGAPPISIPSARSDKADGKPEPRAETKGDAKVADAKDAKGDDKQAAIAKQIQALTAVQSRAGGPAAPPSH